MDDLSVRAITRTIRFMIVRNDKRIKIVFFIIFFWFYKVLISIKLLSRRINYHITSDCEKTSQSPLTNIPKVLFKNIHFCIFKHATRTRDFT